MRCEVNNVSFRYSRTEPWVLKDVSLTVSEDERVGLVGVSGRGKTTLLKLIAGYLRPSSGQILLDGKSLPAEGFSPVQLIYQHPEKAVNPRWRLKDIVSEAWQPTSEVLTALGIEPEWLSRWPNELSGGELQRFCIARALAPDTKIILADEISTMLDVITQAQIWNFLVEYVKAYKIGMLMVTHNQALAEKICTRIIKL